MSDPSHLTDEELAHRRAAADAVLRNQIAADAFARGICSACHSPQVCARMGCPRPANTSSRTARSAA